MYMKLGHAKGMRNMQQLLYFTFCFIPFFPSVREQMLVPAPIQIHIQKDVYVGS